MDRRISLTTVAALVLWLVAIGLISAEAWLDMSVGLLGVLFGLIALGLTVRGFFVQTSRPVR